MAAPALLPGGSAIAPLHKPRACARYPAIALASISAEATGAYLQLTDPLILNRLYARKY